jgi:hypothetical protein
MTPQVHEVVTFGPFEEYFGDMATEAPHHSRNVTNSPWILLLKIGSYGPYKFRICTFGPLVNTTTTTGSITILNPKK